MRPKTLEISYVYLLLAEHEDNTDFADGTRPKRFIRATFNLSHLSNSSDYWRLRTTTKKERIKGL